MQIATTPDTYANIRAEATASSAIVGRLTDGERVEVESHLNDWTQILTEQGVRGWVFPQVTFTSIDKVEPDKNKEPIPLSFPVAPDKPVGAGGWPDDWYDANHYGHYYEVGTLKAFHTGADLNRPKDADNNNPIYAVAPSTVLWAGKYPAWGNLVVLKLRGYAPDGICYRVRYGHMRKLNVKRGDNLERGDLIGTVGDADGRYSPHLHFDLSPTNILDTNPAFWPGLNLKRLKAEFVDPLQTILQNGGLTITQTAL